MNYFKKDGQVYAYDDEQVAAGFGEGMTPLTDKEVYAIEHPSLTEDEMKEWEISQDKLLLTTTDWIVAKIGEASMLGQDTKPLLEQYAEQLEQRELARVRIRIAEGRA